MNRTQEERLVVAFEQIAEALTGIHDTQERQFAKQWPERKEVRDAVYSRVPNEEDRIRAEHGVSDESLVDWLSLPEEEIIGARERAYLAAQAAASRAEAAGEGGPGGGGAEAAEGEAATTDGTSTDHGDVQTG